MDWLEPWVAITDLDWPEQKKVEYCSAWERQLAREVGPQHVLRGTTATLVARRFDTDDALFQIPNGQLAEVHLTWSCGEEPDPTWPVAAIFFSLDEWARESMAEQHREWAANEP
ncbi:hypothetical protein [Sphingomonas sp.]|jgi:hypothetical protein|uniref:hypothetical protein n=1 Tax=Sphingomonas sp. TaxID=28214 RepID=UPI002ED873D1